MTAPSHGSGHKLCLGAGLRERLASRALRFGSPASEFAFGDIADQVDDVSIVTANVEALAEYGVLGDSWILPPPPAFPRQKAIVPDASGVRMTAVSVPSTSNRRRPSSLAGTTCRRDRSRISTSAHRSTIRCRTDRSGPFRRCVRHPDPLARQLRFLPTAPTGTESLKRPQSPATC